MLGVFAQFETAIRKERQMERIAKAKANGVYKGRKPSVDVVAVRSLRNEASGLAILRSASGSVGRASTGPWRLNVS